MGYARGWWPFDEELGRRATKRGRTRTAAYACPSVNCGKSFNWKGNLNRHLRYECGLQPRFKCPYCEYRCKVKGDVCKHIARKHRHSAVYVVDLFAASDSTR